MTRPPIHFRLTILLALAGSSIFWSSTIHAQPPSPEKASFHLAVDRTAYDGGSTARVAALVSIEHGWHVNSHQPTFDYLIPTVLDLELPAGWPEETLQYPKAEMQTFAFADQPLAVYEGDVVILAEVRVPEGTPQGSFPVRASLRYQACNESQCLPPVTTKAEAKLTVGPDGQPVESAAFSSGGAGAGRDPAGAGKPGAAGAGLPWMLAVALFGGLILNAMPCVLPVLSLKVFGLVRS